eukprot:TRINITY_DN2841_c3_g5_i1.p1 TRINITY_DN2841_c3_g5~~TRINITY_DN2841_c3_g5_i1.p1  ORF type:complete len:302 (-),score=40.92 TRINITY_DN2841_c3_g5_i1:473-1378(-)
MFSNRRYVLPVLLVLVPRVLSMRSSATAEEGGKEKKWIDGILHHLDNFVEEYSSCSVECKHNEKQDAFCLDAALKINALTRDEMGPDVGTCGEDGCCKCIKSKWETDDVYELCDLTFEVSVASYRTSFSLMALSGMSRFHTDLLFCASNEACTELVWDGEHNGTIHTLQEIREDTWSNKERSLTPVGKTRMWPASLAKMLKKCHNGAKWLDFNSGSHNFLSHNSNSFTLAALKQLELPVKNDFSQRTAESVMRKFRTSGLTRQVLRTLHGVSTDIKPSPQCEEALNAYMDPWFWIETEKSE